MDNKTCWFTDKQNQIVTDGRNSWSLEVEDLREELSRRMSMIEDLEAWKEKARPFLMYALSSLKAEGSQQSFNQLTELLGAE